VSSTSSTGSDPDAIREEIEHTRADLADTVDALQYKLDVKARAKDQARATGQQLRERSVELKDQAAARSAQLKDQAAARSAQLRAQATTDDGKPRPELLAAAAALVVAVAAVVWWRRR
jgi:hypothetical protein